MKFSLLYVGFIVAINWGFSVVPMLTIWGQHWPPLSIVVGAIFVLRDFAQREVGQRVLLLMLLGAALSFIMASPFVAFASCAAFVASELVDWAVYSLTRWPFGRRVVVSTIASAPVDSFVFLFLIGAASPIGIAIMTASKLVGIAISYRLARDARVA